MMDMQQKALLKTVTESAEVEVHLKHIHIISTFFYSDFLSPPTNTCKTHQQEGMDDESRCW
uniref:Uncharacterized protein n=1 Tax=Octopus bimaculoides TaxID=37653 RepID=A0A0L8G2Y8_OCTBM